jgi:hypothetical protein
MRDVEPGSCSESRDEIRKRRKHLILLDLACYSGVLASLAIVITVGYLTITLAAVQGLRSVYFYLILAMGCSAALVSGKLILRASRVLMDRVLRSHLDRVFNSKSRSNHIGIGANRD